MSTLLSIFFGAILSVWEAFVLRLLWAWFLVPMGLPAIGMAQAFGVSALAGLMTHQAPTNIGEDERTAQALTWGVVAPAAALLSGWIAKGLM